MDIGNSLLAFAEKSGLEAFLEGNSYVFEKVLSKPLALCCSDASAKVKKELAQLDKQYSHDRSYYAGKVSGYATTFMGAVAIADILYNFATKL